MSTVDTAPEREDVRPLRPAIWRLIFAFGLGCVAALSGSVFGMPGKGEFVPIIWVAGLVAFLIAPGWPGFVALISGSAVSAAILDISDGTFGLVFLIVAVVSALAAHGALTAAVLLRLRTLGLGRGLRDERVLAGGGLALGLVLIFAWFASDLARNPP